MPNIKYAFLSILLTFQALIGLSQTPEIDSLQILQTAGTVLDSLSKSDSLLQIIESQSVLVDSIKNETKDFLGDANLETDSVYVPKAKPKGDVETTIDYQARDSILFDFTDQQMYLFGESQVVYGNMELSAERINVNWVDNSIQANYVEDSTGKKIGKPIFKEAGTNYETDDMKYNFKSRKAVINGIITEQDGAIMHGKRVKKNEKDELYIREAKYTTCDLARPHFHIQSTKLKVIPNNKLLSGPFNLHFGNIPTPIGFPFGMFPEPQEKASGIIFPSYGEDNTRGFFLRQLGYYFYLGEYADLKITSDIYSKGSYGVQGLTRYKVRYKFGGNLNVRYNKTVSTDFENDSFSEDFWVNWSHTPETFGTSRFSASVSAGTSNFTANNNNLGYNYNSNVNSQFSSNVSYSKTFKGTPFNMSVNARHSQNISTGLVSVSMPEISFNASRMLPFQNVPALQNTPLNKLGFTYQMSVTNQLSNAAVSSSGLDNVINTSSIADSLVDFNADNWSIIMDRAKRGVRHRIPISTSFALLKNFTVAPSFNYTEVWYPNELRYEYDEEEEGVRIDTLQGFSRAGWYSGGASVSTRLYGFFPVGGKNIQAIRHVMTPSVGLSLSPDFSDPDRGYYQEVQESEDEDDVSLVSKYQGFVYGGAPLGESATVSFSLNNNIEMKVLSKSDTLDDYKKVKIFDNLSMSGSYNMLADSFNLSNFNWNARTSFFKSKLSVNMSGTLDPYVYVLDSIQEVAGGSDVVYDRRIDRYSWNNGDGLGQLSRFNIALGLNLAPKEEGGKDRGDRGGVSATPGGAPGREDNFEAGNVNQFIATDPTQYVPFKVPWRLSVNYSLNYTKSGFDESRITQTLNFNGSISLTDKTEVTVNSGYDLEAKEFTFTQVNVTRDLHCWNIGFNWVPFGLRQSYFVSIQVSSAVLKDLKLDKRTQPTIQVF